MHRNRLHVRTILIAGLLLFVLGAVQPPHATALPQNVGGGTFWLGFDAAPPPSGDWGDSAGSGSGGSGSGGSGGDNGSNSGSGGGSGGNTDNSTGGGSGGSSGNTENSAGGGSGGDSSGSTSGGSASDGGSSSGGGTPSGDSQGNTINEYDPDIYQQYEEEQEALTGAPRLSYLAVEGVALSPSFSSTTTSYMANLSAEMAGAWISARAERGTVYIGGEACNSRYFYHENKIHEVRVTVQDGNLATSYLIYLVPAETTAVVELDKPYAARLEISGAGINVTRELAVTDANTEMDILLPEAATEVQLRIITPDGVNVYYNNVRVSSGYYLPASGQWSWPRDLTLGAQTTLVGIHLRNQADESLFTYYGFRLIQPTSIRIQLQVDNKIAVVNDELQTLDVAPVIMDGHTVVPLRFIAESLGASVEWQEESQRVSLLLEGSLLTLTIGEKSTICRSPLSSKADARWCRCVMFRSN